VVTGITVAIVTVVVGAGAVVAGGAVVATVVVVAPFDELPHPAIPNAAAIRITENARRRGTRFPFEVPASTIGSPQTSSKDRNYGKTSPPEKWESNADDLGFQARQEHADATR